MNDTRTHAGRQIQSVSGVLELHETVFQRAAVASLLMRPDRHWGFNSWPRCRSSSCERTTALLLSDSSTNSTTQRPGINPPTVTCITSSGLENVRIFPPLAPFERR